MDVSTLRMREATITAGIWLTYGVGGLGMAYVALTLQRPHRIELAALFAFATVAGILVSLLPRERIVRSRLREPFFFSWTLLDFAMVMVGTLADGGTASPLVLVFFIPVVFSAMSYPLGSVVAVGILSVLSYLTLALTAGGSSPAYEAAFAVALACTAAMSAWQAQNHNRQHRALATVSRTDPLTGCLNRRGFEERAVAEIGAMTRRGRSGAVVVLDIDRFKPVNDIFGHAAGDELLCWVSKTIERVVRPADAVGRMGGDEFAVLLPELESEQARVIANRIGEALAERAPASLGLAIFPDDGADLEALTHRADMRLYALRQDRAEHAHAQPAQTATAAADISAASSAPPEEGFGPINLWRAALDAMPSRATNGRRAREHTNLQAALLDQIDASLIVTDMSGQVISWNSGAQALYGWSSDEAVGRSARDLVVPEDAQAAERLVGELRRDGRWDGELLVRRKDRSTFTAYVRNRLILDEDGSPSAIVGVAVDISARVAWEAELLQSRDYAQAVTECMGDGLLTLDVAGRVTYINRTAEAMLGWPDGELRGHVVGDVMHPLLPDGSVRPFEASPVARALSEEETVRVEDDRFLARSGRELPVAYTAAPFRTKGGLQGCVVIFQDISERKHREDEHRRDVATLACINRVEAALAEERFELYAQPIVDLRTGETVQQELLLRMREPDGRIAAPGEFLHVAEQYTLISEIDWWVIKRATRLAGSGCPVQLNISARSVGDLDVLGHIERCIEQYEVPLGMLVFEITETAIVEDEEAARMFAERLHALGCKVALDDFGTGYGSLTYLKQIPVDYLKLDIEFVRDLASNRASHHVVQAIVALARDFRLQTVAEGVEDAEVLDLLTRLGVDFAQGYHIARPAPFAERPGDQSAPVRIEPRAVRRQETRRPHNRRRATPIGRRRAEIPPG
jgi:diguanylate cyclase (GGDEF)-like protein/PAS domain S-box-containing protein